VVNSSTTRKIILILGGVVSISILLLYFFVSPEKTELLPKCPLYMATGYYCTGCGSQRALHDLLHLDFAGVVNHNLLFLPALGVVVYYGLLKWLEFKKNRTYHTFLNNRSTPIIILVIVVLFTILRNIEGYPFNMLAP